MYSWGADTDDWASPGAYKFDSARKAAMDADAKAAVDRGGRTYLGRKEPDLARVDPRGKRIVSESANPVVVAVDVTGSMAQWPREIFDRLPLLYQTLSQYRPDLEVSFAAIGDATSDKFPLQVTDFGSGIALEDELKAIYGEGGGGGGSRESYELFGYFVDKQCSTPRAGTEEGERPFLIIYGDEGFYPHVDPKQVQHYLGVGIQEKVSSAEVWRSLASKWDLYLLRKSYGSAEQDATVVAQWSKVLDPQRIILLPDELRAVDYALGLVARRWGRFEDFKANMAARQEPAKVAALAHSLDARPKSA